MSETSPTEGDSNAGSAPADLPDNTNQQPTADEQRTDSVSSDTQDSDQNNDNQPDDQTTGDDSSSSSTDDGLNNFAKAQGFDPDNLTDGERKALKLAHDNQKAFRNSKQEDSDQLRDTVQDVNNVDDGELDDLDEYEAREVRRDSEIAQLRASQKANDFWSKHQDERTYEAKMTEIILDEVKNHGKDAARYLAGDLNRVLILAKAASGASPDEAKNAGAREERERIRKRQEGSADGGQASTTHQAPKKLTRADITAMPDEEYKKIRDSGELDEIIARGDLY